MPPSASTSVPTSAQLPARRRWSPLKRRTCCSSAPPATALLAEVSHAPPPHKQASLARTIASANPLQNHRQLTHRGCAAHMRHSVHSRRCGNGLLALIEQPTQQKHTNNLDAR